MNLLSEKNIKSQNAHISEVCLSIICAIIIVAMCILYFKFGTPEKLVQRALKNYGFPAYTVELEKQGHNTYILKNPPVYDGVLLTDWEIESFGITSFSALAISKDISNQVRVSATVTIPQSRYSQIEEQAAQNRKSVDAYLNDMLQTQLEKSTS